MVLVLFSILLSEAMVGGYYRKEHAPLTRRYSSWYAHSQVLGIEARVIEDRLNTSVLGSTARCEEVQHSRFKPNRYRTT